MTERLRNHHYHLKVSVIINCNVFQGEQEKELLCAAWYQKLA